MTAPASVTGEFKRGSDGTTFHGYVDIGDDRINCRLVPQKDPDLLVLEVFDLEVPTSRTGRFFIVMKEKE